MKRIFITLSLYLVVIFPIHAQKVREKKDIVYMDGTALYKQNHTQDKPISSM